MRRRIELLDQQLGDFAPLRQSLNQLQLERILARTALTLLSDYQQILQENRDQMQLPGWWYRGQPQEYLGSWVQASQYSESRCGQDPEEASCGVSVHSMGVPHQPYRRLYRTIDNAVTAPYDVRRRPYAVRRGYTRGSARAYR